MKCFLLIPTGRQRLALRRYVNNGHNECPVHGYHDARVWIGEQEELKGEDGIIKAVPLDLYQDDPRWPAKCDCGYEFQVTDERAHDQVFTRSIWKRTDTGEELLLEEAPVGAMWDAPWMRNRIGPDGKSLHVICPGGQTWSIDGRARNCDSPCANCGRPYHAHNDGDWDERKRLCPVGYQDARPHQCWVRHGEPPNITVSKDGVTCGAGAGSIQTDNYHGFLRDGSFTPC